MTGLTWTAARTTRCTRRSSTTTAWAGSPGTGRESPGRPRRCWSRPKRGGGWAVLAVFFSAGTYLNSYYVAALIPAVAALCGTGIAACGPRPWPARVRLIVAATVLGCVGYGAYLLSGAAPGPVVVSRVALVVAVAALAQLVLPSSSRAGHLTAAAFAGAAVLLLPAAAA